MKCGGSRTNHTLEKPGIRFIAYVVNFKIVFWLGF